MTANEMTPNPERRRHFPSNIKLIEKELEMSNPNDSTLQQDGATSSSRRQLLKAGAALAALLIMAASTARAQAADAKVTATMTDTKSEEFINGMADLMAHSTRTPILRWPPEYGMEYEEIFFSAMDGVTIEGWFIPADSDRLIICNHAMQPLRLSGPPGALDQFRRLRGELPAGIQGPA
jgi:hypothetical protein